MDRRYAIIIDGKVANVAIWDGKSEWKPETGDVVKCPEKVGIGWAKIDGKWVAPEEPVE